MASKRISAYHALALLLPVVVENGDNALVVWQGLKETKPQPPVQIDGTHILVAGSIDETR